MDPMYEKNWPEDVIGQLKEDMKYAGLIGVYQISRRNPTIRNLIALFVYDGSAYEFRRHKETIDGEYWTYEVVDIHNVMDY